MDVYKEDLALTGIDESPIDAVDITNDFMFAYVMRNPEICIELLQYLLPGQKIRDIKYLDLDETEDSSKATPTRKRNKPETQKVLMSEADKRGVRLDAYLDDGKTVYNIEMQTSEDRAIAKRARLYQAHIDINQLDRGQNYDQLKPCFVIFICKVDPFKEGMYCYTFENTCREKSDLCLNDEAYKLFFNTQGTRGDISEKLKELLRYMNDTRAYPVEQTEVGLIRKIEHVVKTAKKDEDWRRAFMTYQIHQREAELRGIEIGQQRGIEIGEMTNKTVTAKKMILKKLPVDMIVEITGLSLFEVKALQAQCLN